MRTFAAPVPLPLARFTPAVADSFQSSSPVRKPSPAFFLLFAPCLRHLSPPCPHRAAAPLPPPGILCLSSPIFLSLFPQHYRRAALSTEGISLESRQENKKADGGADELGDRIGDTKNPDPEDASQAFYMKGKVTALLATLKEKERKVCVGMGVWVLPYLSARFFSLREPSSFPFFTMSSFSSLLALLSFFPSFLVSFLFFYFASLALEFYFRIFRISMYHKRVCTCFEREPR